MSKHTLDWDYITTMQEEAWRVYAGFFIHRGPNNPLGANMGSIGCVEICGAGEWDRYNNTIKSFTGLQSEFQIGNNRLLTAQYESATRPPLIIVRS